MADIETDAEVLDEPEAVSDGEGVMAPDGDCELDKVSDAEAEDELLAVSELEGEGVPVSVDEAEGLSEVERDGDSLPVAEMLGVCDVERDAVAERDKEEGGETEAVVDHVPVGDRELERDLLLDLVLDDVESAVLEPERVEVCVFELVVEAPDVLDRVDVADWEGVARLVPAGERSGSSLDAVVVDDDNDADANDDIVADADEEEEDEPDSDALLLAESV